jgi:glycosyltransferase involved in cell wall biosynthesis
MSKAQLVSFLIPYLNHKQYAGQKNGCILNNTYPNKEVIINNDSTDNDFSIINDQISMNSHMLPIKFISRMIRGKL